MKLTLQKLLFPKETICPESSLYFRGYKGAKYVESRHYLRFKNHSYVKFDTYFNSFSMKKWAQYTTVSNLYLSLKAKGKFCVTIWTGEAKKGAIKIVFHDYFEDNGIIEIPIKCRDIVYFTLDCVSENGIFYGGEYYTETEQINDINLCGIICTFRREEFILKNLQEINKNILLNKESPLHDKFKVIVSDNGHTLPKTRNKNIFIYENKNAGGAGGFTRGIIESLNLTKQYNFTNILLLDDDILLDCNVLERLYAFLCMQKPEYTKSYVGGAMLRLDKKTIQSDMANNWVRHKGTALNHNANMSKFKDVIKNENPCLINYLSWWFCCMPIGAVSERNLPLPVFIKRDDIEYGLRTGSSFITLNGICVWHEPFEAKRPAYLEYYYIRNQLIMECASATPYTRKQLIKVMQQSLIVNLTKLKYVEFKFFIEGIQDFCKGIEWLKLVDATKLNDELRSMDRKMVPLEELPIEFDEKKYFDSFKYRESKKHHIFRNLTFNGWLLPAKKEPAIVQSAFPIKLPFYRRKTALNVEYLSKKGYITTRSWKELFNCLSLYRKTVSLVKKEYPKAVAEYKERWHEITNIDFWTKYLTTEGLERKDILDIKPTLEPVDQIQKRKKQGYYEKCLKLKVNKKQIYVESRKGGDFASNIFAIVKELQNEEYKNYQIYIGVTEDYYPIAKEKCSTYKFKRIHFVIKDSYKFQKVLATSKYFFTDFHLCPTFVKRDEQIVVSMWHGTPLKTLGKDCKAETQTSVQRIFYLADYNVYPGKFMEEKMIDVYWMKNLCNNTVLRTGYPRNALFFDEERREQIRKELNLEGKTAIIYMPTFRGSAGDNKNVEQNEQLISYFDELDKTLKDNQILYVKLHNYNSEAIDLSGYKHICAAPIKYDNYEFQNACDVLITDYSSVFFDFAVSRRKIILFQYDQEDYLKNRGVCIPLNELPFPIVKTVKELVKEINSPINYDDAKFLKTYATYDNKDAAKTLCEHVILSKEEKVNSYKLKPNKKRNIFIYTGELKTQFKAAKFWDCMDKLDYDKNNYFCLFYDPVMWKNAERLLPMNEKCGQVGMWSYGSYSMKEFEIRNKFVKNVKLSRKEEEIFEKFNKRELQKHFGNKMKISRVVLWNCTNEIVLSMYKDIGKKRYVVFSGKPAIKSQVVKNLLENYTITTEKEFKTIED